MSRGTLLLSAALFAACHAGERRVLETRTRLGSAVELSLLAVTDATGTKNSANPGVAVRTFARGETIRITFTATNSGEPVSTRVVINVWAPDRTRPFQESAPSVAPLASEDAQYYSFDWTAPLDAAIGNYAVSASIRSATDFSTIYDTLVPGPGTGWGAGDTLADQFSVTLNPCVDDNGGCDANATCTVAHAAATCACNEGWSGDGLVCTRLGVELTLHAVSDTSGTKGTSTPGRPCATFAPGDTVRLTLKATNTGPPVAPWPFINVWSPTSERVFQTFTEALPPLGTGSTQYYSYDWVIPPDAQTGGYGVSASLREVSSFETLHDTFVPGPSTGWGPGDTLRNVFAVVRGVSLTLYDITDATGTKHTASPGESNPRSTGLDKATFARGDTVRVTLKAQNSGPAVIPHVVLNLWAPRGSIGRVLDASVRSTAPLGTGEAQYFSFDWVVPDQAPLGAYALSASVRDGASFGTIYDTLVPGPSTGWGSGDSLSEAFVIAPISRIAMPFAKTGVTTLIWTSVPGAQAYRLWIGTKPKLSDVVDTGSTTATSRAVADLPAGPLWGQVWTYVGSQWLSSGYVLFTRDPAWTASELASPQDGATGVDPGEPFQWSRPPLAFGYRLRIGTQVGASDLADSGWIRVTRRLLPPLPAGVLLHGRLETQLPDRVEARDFTFTLRTGAAGPSTETQIANALWATGFVRQMAGLDNYPAPYTPLLDETRKIGQEFAVCSQFAAALLDVLRDMNVTLPSRLLRIGFNPNFYEMHDLTELYDADRARWMVLDPLFAVAPRRSSNGEWATAEDVRNATLAKTFDAIAWVSLDSMSEAVLSRYYVDYPLLYVNVWHAEDQIVWGSGTSIAPYLTAAPLDAASARWLVVQGPAPVTVLADGASRLLTVGGVGGTSRMFRAKTVTPQEGEFALFEVLRYVFPLAAP